MQAVASPPVANDQRMLLRNVSWDTYERLLADDPGRSVPRLTYDRGVLELVSPLPNHERGANTLRSIVLLVTTALEIPIDQLGSTTYRRPDLERGFEPDGSFYIAHEAAVRGKDILDLTVDPPPDLVIEVDVSHSSLDKLELLAAMGIPEVWRHEGQQVAILWHDGTGYREATASRNIPVLTTSVLNQFLAERRALPSHEWANAVSAWAKARRDRVR